MEGLKVKCPNCGKVYWETTDQYDPDARPNGSMVRLLNPWLKNSWPIFGDGIMPRGDGSGTSVTPCAEMDCIGCLAQLAPSGKLKAIEPKPEMPILIPVEVSEELCNADSMG